MNRPAWSVERAREIVRIQARQPGALLPALHALQEEFGYLSEAAVPLLADELNLSQAEVHGVISFYSDFKTRPPARLEVRLCRGEACQAVGAGELFTHAIQRLGVESGQISADGEVELGEVFCLGNCALGPAMTVNGQLVGRVEPSDFDERVGAYRG